MSLSDCADTPESLTQRLSAVLLHPECTDSVLRSRIQSELTGYGSAPFPSFRLLAITYLDRAGNALPVPPEYQTYPVLHGVPTLELHRKQGLALSLPPPVTAFLQQQVQREVFSGYIAAAQVQMLLAQIRETYWEALQTYSTTDSSMP